MKNKTLCIVSPFPPPYGGMAVQAEKLVLHLECEGLRVISVRTNTRFPQKLAFVSKIPVLRTLLNLILFLSNLRKALHKADTVYFYTGFLNFFFWLTLPAIILIRIYKKRLILSARGGGAGAFFEKYAWLIKPLIRQADCITTPSGFLQKAFENAFDIRPVIVPPLADIYQFHFCERTSFAPRILVTRNFEDIYDVECAVKAFKIINGKYPDANLGLAGDGSRKKELVSLVSALELEKSVFFYGAVDHKKIQELYKEYDILVNPSRVDNLPGTILEAFASGLPVVTTNAGGIPYIVSHGITGLMTEIGDYEGLARNVIKILEKPELGRELAKAGAEYCQAYSWEHIRKILIPLLYFRK